MYSVATIWNSFESWAEESLFMVSHLGSHFLPEDAIRLPFKDSPSVLPKKYLPWFSSQVPVCSHFCRLFSTPTPGPRLWPWAALRGSTKELTDPVANSDNHCPRSFNADQFCCVYLERSQSFEKVIQQILLVWVNEFCAFLSCFSYKSHVPGCWRKMQGVVETSCSSELIPLPERCLLLEKQSKGQNHSQKEIMWMT